MILLVLAGGVGSRYGGDKQRDGVGPNGEWISDYNMHDAGRAGFDTAVFVTRPGMGEEISRRFQDRAPAGMSVRVCEQRLDDVPPGRSSSDRAKPWGTAHAVWSARAELDAPFLVVNADDCYGPGAFLRAAEWLRRAEAGRACLVAYRLRETLSAGGSVSRGVCDVDGDRLRSVVEHLEIRSVDSVDSVDGGKRIVSVGGDGTSNELDTETLVSMNAWCLHPSVLPQFTAAFEAFLDGLPGPKAEFQLPTVLDALIRSGRLSVEVAITEERWYGITYREDREAVVEHLRSRGPIAEGPNSATPE